MADKRKKEMNRKIAAIREFAMAMGYEVSEVEYTHPLSERPCLSIELIGTSDSNGFPYDWCVFLDTGEVI